MTISQHTGWGTSRSSNLPQILAMSLLSSWIDRVLASWCTFIVVLSLIKGVLSCLPLRFIVSSICCVVHFRVVCLSCPASVMSCICGAVCLWCHASVVSCICGAVSVVSCVCHVICLSCPVSVVSCVCCVMRLSYFITIHGFWLRTSA